MINIESFFIFDEAELSSGFMSVLLNLKIFAGGDVTADDGGDIISFLFNRKLSRFVGGDNTDLIGEDVIDLLTGGEATTGEFIGGEVIGGELTAGELISATTGCDDAFLCNRLLLNEGRCVSLLFTDEIIFLLGGDEIFWVSGTASF